MSLKRLLCGVGCVALAWGQASAADPVVSSFVGTQSPIILTQADKDKPPRKKTAPPIMPQTPQTPTRPTPEPMRPDMSQMNQPSTDAFSQAPPAGGEAAGSFAPQM